MNAIRCDKCLHVVEHDPKTTNGCLCDPDSPTWIAYFPDGRIYAGSHSRSTLV